MKHRAITASGPRQRALLASLFAVLALLLAPGAADAVNFTGPVNFAAGSQPFSVAVADFNSDSKSDLVVANFNSDNVSLLLGDGLGGFSAPTNFGMGDGPFSIAIGDFNADSKPDIATANENSDNISVRLGNGTGGFGGATTIAIGVGSAPQGIAVGDFNNDSNADLAVANLSFNSSDNVTVLLGDGSGGFGTPTNFPAEGPGSGPIAVAVGDFNADSNSDLAVANFNKKNVSILRGDGTGGFAAAPGSPLGVVNNPFSIAVRDLNADSRPDLAVANFTSNVVSVLLADGSGGFNPRTDYNVASQPRGVASGDFNGDGTPDLVTGNYNNNNASVILGNGAGAFGSPTNFPVGTGPSSVAVSDFNGDGQPDLAVSNLNSGNVSILLNTSQAYARPKGASPIKSALVPAQQPCTTPNKTHAPPLQFPSCGPPAQTSQFLTIGTPDANGAGAKSVASITWVAVLNPTPTPNDLRMTLALSDVRCRNAATTTCGSTNAAAGPDYTGQVELRAALRITDRNNGPSGTDTGTAADSALLGPGFPVAAPCSETAGDTSIGSTCAIVTTANAIAPGAIVTGKRAIWELRSIQVWDGGSTGIAGAADATLFEVSGLFIP
jgi:FG-GAP-like repeat